MITTYSYLDQYKQMGGRAALDYFTVISIRGTPHSMKLVVSDGVEYTIDLALSSGGLA